MKLKPIIQELRAHCPGFDGRVFGVGTFSRLDESVAAELLPAAFVIPVSEDPEEPAVINRYKQQVRFNFAVILMVANTEDEQGLTAWEKSVDLKKEVFQAILGADDIQAGRDWIQFESLTVLNLNRAALTVQLDFSCQYEISDNETRHGGDIDRLGRFLRMYTDVDVIGDKGRPDGQIEAKMHINLEQEK